MLETELPPQFWQLVWGAIALQSSAFEMIQSLPNAHKAAVYVVLLAGLSQEIGQSIILFLNRVKPFRFLLSLVIGSVLFALGYLFWAFSTWGIAKLLFAHSLGFKIVQATLGFAYAPQIFSFLVALPYFGAPISVLLTIWSFLGLLLGLSIALRLDVLEAAVCGMLGWLVLQMLQRTIGRPFTSLGRWLSNTAAGVNLVTDLKKLEQLVESGKQPGAGE